VIILNRKGLLLLVIGVLLLFCLGVLNEGTNFGFNGWSLSLMSIGLFGVLFWAVSAIFWIWMLIDCVTNDFRRDTDKIVWILVIIFLHVLGALIYYLLIKVRGYNKKPKIKPKKRKKKK
jgi:hypothetical protein